MILMDRAFREIQRDTIDPNIPGFHWSNHGRGAIIYFVENQSIVNIYAEMPGVRNMMFLFFGRQNT